MGSIDKGQEFTGCAVSPQPLQHRQAAASRYRRCCTPLPTSSSAVAAFHGELSSLLQASLLAWHSDLSQVGGAGSVARPPPHHTPIASQPKAAHPAALNSHRELIPCPGKGECPRGRTAATPLGVCQVLISLREHRRCRWHWLPP